MVRISHKCVLMLGAAVFAILPGVALANGLPSGGQVVAGTGSISQSGSTMTITQESQNMAANWQSFSIGQGHTVNFQQPSSNAVALNRVLGSDVSVIQGALNANGKVFLINPNGVTFTPDAQVNVGGLVASTLNISTDDFMAGNYRFEGDSTQAVSNSGSINAPGGTVALIAARIINDGTITADGGAVLMGAGSRVVLDLGGPVKLEVEEGALQTQIDQGGAIRADGGRIYLTAKAAGALATSVINHTGISEAKTLVTGQKGEIVLLGDMTVGTANIAGELNATAPAAGDGGFIETSAANVNIAEGTTITAGSAHGKGGLWLIDPFDYVIDAAAASNIAGALNTGTDVTIQTTVNNAAFGSTGAGANGNIKVDSAINKTAGGDATLTLEAENVIDLAAPITSTSGALNLVLNADSDANGSGVIIATKGTSLNGGNLSFGVGDTAMLGGVSTLVGGDVYVGGTEQVVFRTGGGRIDLFGELIIANPDGVKFITDNGDARFYGIINGGNKYEKITGVNLTWDQAFDLAKNGTAGGSAVGDSYLATITSRLENSVVVYTGGFVTGAALADGAWLGGKRVEGIGSDTIWRWVAGPEAEEDGGNGRPFFDGAHFSNIALIDGAFINWQSNEPNGGIGGENRLQIGDSLGRWNDLSNNNIPLDIIIRETNYGDADLEIDAGTGTVTFDKPIGGLKGINYVAYDASNPNPNRPTTTTTTQIPQQSAVSNVQATAGQPQQTGTSPGSINLPSSLSSSSGSTQSGGSQGPGMIGSMEIVQIKSESSQSASSGNAESSGDQLDFASLAQQGTISDLTKVFVIDGGLNMPQGAQSDEDEDSGE